MKILLVLGSVLLCSQSFALQSDLCVKELSQDSAIIQDASNASGNNLLIKKSTEGSLIAQTFHPEAMGGGGVGTGRKALLERAATPALVADDSITAKFGEYLDARGGGSGIGTGKASDIEVANLVSQLNQCAEI